jgi:Domain of unknown function (DUF4331)
MKRPLALVGTLAVAVGVLAGTSIVPIAGASSHREAPSISRDPEADNTDLYAFVSPDKPNTVTFVANYIPLQDPAGGPNFNSFGDDVLYSINVDNKGDGEDHIQYQFRFKTTIRNPNTFLYNTGPISSPSDPDWNMPQTYSVTRVENGKATKLADDLLTPPDNIGPRSTPNYNDIATQAVHSLSGVHGTGKVFAGQRDDPFFVDLGSIFDLGGLRPFNSLHLLPLANEPGRDNLQGLNVHSIVIQVPITDLTADHSMPSGASDPKAVIGVYASASRHKVTVLDDDNANDIEQGPFVQVSRLGEPLINEVIIPLGQKDKWNRHDPADDVAFVDRYKNPELAGLINLLYPSLPNAPTTGRDDLVTILLTGIPGVNFLATGDTKADLLRLNMMIPPSNPNPNNVDRLGALAGQFDGFPNGRRLADDIVDIELRAVACGYGPILQSALGLCNLSPNNQIGDGVDHNDVRFRTTFPYVANPHQGYEVEPIQSAP